MSLSLKTIDVGFDLRLQGIEVVLPLGRISVVTDDKVYQGETDQVANQMRADGWKVKIERRAPGTARRGDLPRRG